MQVTVETSSGLERRMTVQVPEEKISEQVKDRLKSMGKTARL
ncbi:MAG: trigger factor, partial [Gammaproteobacteria bacterium]|nr:trigger factor [Gammaproteobacteria bacterium]